MNQSIFTLGRATQWTPWSLEIRSLDIKTQKAIAGALWFWAVCLAISVSNIGSVGAQELIRPETVKTRARPWLDPLGIRVGNFNIFPKLLIQERYSDNIFLIDQNEIDDFITLISPQLHIRSDWNTHALNFHSAARIRKHINNETQDTEDYNFNTDGRIDILRESRLTGGAGFARNHQDRSSPDDVFGLDPTIFREASAFSSYHHDFKPFSVRTTIDFYRVNFDDVRRGTQIINNDDRDRNRIAGEFQVSYEFFPRYSAFVRGSVNQIDYNDRFNDLGLARSSEGFELNVGSQFYGSGVLFGELFIGYLDQKYDDSRLRRVNGISGGGKVTWLPSGLTTVTLASSRTVHETTIDLASGTFQTQAKVEVDHELRRNFLLNLSIYFIESNFVGIQRDDNDIGLLFSANYLMNRYVNFELRYNFEKRDSNQVGSDYTGNSVSFGLSLQL